MKERSAFAAAQLRRRLRLLMRDWRSATIGGGRRWLHVRAAALTRLLALATALVVAQNLLPYQLNMRPGDVANRDVNSPRSVTYESVIKTQEARTAAAARIPDQFDTAVAAQQVQALQTLGSRVSDLRQSGSSGRERSAELSPLGPQLSYPARDYSLQAGS